MPGTTLDPAPPAPEVSRTAAKAASALSGVLEREHEREQIAIAPADAPQEQIVVPTLAFALLLEILREMSRGNGVTVMPVGAELTTQEVANLLNVSRPYVVKLIQERALPARKVGNRRKVRLVDVLAYKERDDAARREAIAAFANEAQELDIY
jgi:excisionase family DNA binding protein